MIERNCPLGPLNDAETAFLPTMIIIGAMKVVADFACYEDHTDDPDRVFINTWRFIDSIKFMRRCLEHSTVTTE